MRNRCIYIIILCFMFNLAGCSPRGSQDDPKESDMTSTPALEYWQEKNTYEPVFWAEADIDGDGRTDTVLIYRIEADKCRICGIMNTKQGFSISESMKAPVENHTIRFEDIDKKAPTEIIVSGSKNGKVGYVILRLENNQLIDIFGDSMDDCCN